MSTFSLIPDNKVQVGANITVQLFRKLRDNPLAMAAGHSTASDNRFELDSIVDSTATDQSKDRLVAFRGAVRESGHASSASGLASNDVTTPIWKVPRSGEYGVHITRETGSSAVIYINNVRVHSSASTNHWLLLTVARGDNVTVKYVTNSNSTLPHRLKVWFYTNNPVSDFACLGGVANYKYNQYGGTPEHIRPIGFFDVDDY